MKRSVQTWLTVLGLISASEAMASTPKAPTAQDQWRWFEVEVLVFKQTAANQLEESFPLPVKPVETASSFDLLSPYVAPSLRDSLLQLSECESDPENWFAPLNYPKSIDLLACHDAQEVALIPFPQWPITTYDRFAHISATPIIYDGENNEIENASHPFIVAEDRLELDELRRQLEQRGQGEALLHMSYMQPVFNRNANYQVRLYGGKNYTDEFDIYGFAKPSTEQKVAFLQQAKADDQLSRIDQLLELVNQQGLEFQIGDDAAQTLLPARPPYREAGLSKQVWELDGLLHIYLVGNYLHVATDLNLREPTTVREATPDITAQADAALNGRLQEQPFLRAYAFSQLRRVISHETHYFDHPKLGVVVQIRRTDLSANR